MTAWWTNRGLLSLWLSGLLFAPPQFAAAVDFERDVAPILIRRCVECHAGAEPSGKFDLTTADGIGKGGESGAAVVAGKPDDSFLWQRLRDGEMPPKNQGKSQALPANEVEQLRRYRWPGNIRELKNMVERAVLLAPADHIDAEDLILTTLATSDESGDVVAPKSVYEPLSLEEVERRHILHTLNATGWNKSRTSAILGIERSTLDRKIQRYKLTQNHPQPEV